MKKRPQGVLLVAMIVLIAALLIVIEGLAIFIPGTPLDMIWAIKSTTVLKYKDSVIGLLLGYIVFIIGLFLIFKVWGLMNGLKWAWWTILIVFIVKGIEDLLSIAFGGGFVGVPGVLISSIFLIYLTRPHVREHFNKKTNETSK